MSNPCCLADGKRLKDAGWITATDRIWKEMGVAGRTEIIRGGARKLFDNEFPCPSADEIVEIFDNSGFELVLESTRYSDGTPCWNVTAYKPSGKEKATENEESLLFALINLVIAMGIGGRS